MSERSGVDPENSFNQTGIEERSSASSTEGFMKFCPQDIPTEQTTRFLMQWLPRSPARVLDVGCGTGVIAAELMLRGYIIQAIDSDPVEVVAARGRSVSAEVATWPAFTPDNPI